MKRSIIIIALFLLHIVSFAQSNSRPSIAVADIDANEIYFANPQQTLSDLVRMEINQMNTYELLDRYDMAFLAKRDSIKIGGCFSKICLIEIGKQLKVDKILTGSIMTIGNSISVSFRVLDVQTEKIEKSHSIEFLKLHTELKAMIHITLSEMYGLPVDAEMKKTLTKRNDYESSVNNPYQLRLRSDGPRMGFTVFTGETAARLKENRSVGGFEAEQTMFQFGYQFEKQYLNEGNFQALFEFIPMMTGLDQGLFIPSFTLMNGLRNNKNGWEFAFGPTFSFVTKSRGFYDPNNNNQWTLVKDTIQAPEGVDVITRLDNRGDLAIQAGFIFAAGKTFKSGKLNIPVNAFIIPNNKGLRFGLSFGFNARDRYAYNNVR